MIRVLTNQYFSQTVGGPQRYGPLFMEALRSRGFDTIGIILKPLPKEEKGPMRVDIHSEPWGEIHTIERFLGLNVMLNDLGEPYPVEINEILSDVTSAVERIAPEVIVLSGFGVSNWYLAEAARRLGIPFVLSHHGFWFHEIGNAPAAIQPRLLRMEQSATEQAAVNVYLNTWSRQLMHQHYPTTLREDDHVIPLPYNPVFLEDVEPLPLDVSEKIVVGFVARWDTIKNVVVVRELAEQARDMYVISPMRIGLRTELKEEEQRFREVVDVREPMLPEDLVRLYRRCDVMILPSRFDVSPTVVMEAALQGKGTIISPNVGWIDLYERHHMNDWVVRDVTAQHLEEAIRTCHALSPPRAFLDEIREKHHPDRVFDLWSSLIQGLRK